MLHLLEKSVQEAPIRTESCYHHRPTIPETVPVINTNAPNGIETSHVTIVHPDGKITVVEIVKK
jgi:hypothetical protein